MREPASSLVHFTCLADLLLAALYPVGVKNSVRSGELLLNAGSHSQFSHQCRANPGRPGGGGGWQVEPQGVGRAQKVVTTTTTNAVNTCVPDSIAWLPQPEDVLYYN